MIIKTNMLSIIAKASVIFQKRQPQKMPGPVTVINKSFHPLVMDPIIVIILWSPRTGKVAIDVQPWLKDPSAKLSLSMALFSV